MKKTNAVPAAALLLAGYTLLAGCVSLRPASGTLEESTPGQAALPADVPSAPVLSAGETVLPLDPADLNLCLVRDGTCRVEESYDGRAFLPFGTWQTDSGPLQYGDRECPAALIGSADDLTAFAEEAAPYFGYSVFFSFLLSRWDEAFFTDRSLLVVYLWMPDTAEPEPGRIELRRNKVPANAAAMLSVGFVTDPRLERGPAECGWFAALEIPKETLASVSRIRAGIS